MGEILVLPPQIGRVLKQVDTVYDGSNSSLGYLLTRNSTIELVNCIKFV